MKTAWLALASTLAALPPGSAAAAKRVGVEEFGVSVMLPAGARLCYGESGTHVHGIYTLLDGQDCGSSRHGPALGVWANYNAAFAPDAVAYLQAYDDCADTGPRWDGEWRSAVGGLPTAYCQRVLPDGRIVVALMGQSAPWGPGFGDEEGRTPRLFYHVWLHTTPSRRERDLATFRTFVRSIRIHTSTD